MSLILVSCTSKNESKQGSNPDGEARQGKLSTNFTLDELRELAEEGEGDLPSSVEVSGIRTLKRDFKEINNQMMLFDEPIRDEDERFDRLEDVVQDIHNELTDFTPGINRLLAIESDIKELHSKLSQLVQSDSLDINTPESTINPTLNAPRQLSLEQGQVTPGRVEPVSESGPIPEVEEAPLPNNATIPTVEAEEVIAQQQDIEQTIADNNGVSVTIRAWQSPDKTRIVFETPRKADYTVRFDKQAGQVNVETGETFSQTQAEALTNTSNQIISANASNNPSTAMSTLSMAVRDVSSISQGFYLSPESDDQAHRYYFDIFR